MKLHHKLIAVLCGVLAILTMGAGRKISDFTETLEPADAWLYEIAVPGVTNYKVTFGTIATQIIARVPSSGGNLVTNANQFGASTTLTLKSGLLISNTVLHSSAIYVPGASAGTIGKVLAQADASGTLMWTNVQSTGFSSTNNFSYDSTNDTLQILDTTGAYAGQVKLNAQSLIQFANSTRLGFGVGGNTNWYINDDGGGDFGHWKPTLSNTYNVASTTQSVKKIWVNDVSLLGVTKARPLFLDGSGNITNVSGTPNGTLFVRDDGVLASPPGGGGDVTTAQLNTASNAVVTLSSNNVRVAAGTGTTVTSAGAGGVQTFTVNASGGVATNANQFGANTTLTIKDGALLTNTIFYGNVGIGTATPFSKLAIKQEVDNQLGGFHIIRNTTADTWSIAHGGDNNLYVSFAPNASGADQVGDFTVNPVIFTSTGNVGIGTNSPAARLHIVADNSVLKQFRFGTTNKPDLVWFDTNGTVGIASNLWVTSNISASLLSVINANINNINLTNALGSNQVRMGMQDLTNSVAVSPTDGQLLAWDSGMKKWTNRTPDSFASTTQMVAGAIGTLHVTNKVGIGVIPTNSTLEILPGLSGAEYVRINDTNGTRRLSLGVLPASTSFGTLWMGDITPSAANYVLTSEGANTSINGTTINLNAAGLVRWQVSASGHLLAGTDGTKSIGANTTGRPLDAFLKGSIATYRSNLIASAAIGIGVSGTNWTNSAVFTALTNNVTVYIDASTATTVATISKNGQQIAASIAASMATVMLKPDEYVTISYSGTAPTARWESW